MTSGRGTKRGVKRRLGIRPGKRDSRLTLRGERGKALRIILFCALGIAAAIALFSFLKPEKQLKSTAEIKRITDRGLLIVGIRNDVPGFSANGEGLEIELAELFAEYLLPDSGEKPVKFVSITAQTAETKLSDGSIDAAIALMQKGGSRNFAYSYPYYTDSCRVIQRKNAPKKELYESLIGYVQNTSASSVLNKYIDSHETKVERSIIDRIRGIEKELPDDAVTFEKKAFASYPDMLTALEHGRIDCAVIPGVYAELYCADYEYEITGLSLGSISYAIASASDEPAIAQLADVFIYELRESGRLDELVKKHGLGGQ